MPADGHAWPKSPLGLMLPIGWVIFLLLFCKKQAAAQPLDSVFNLPTVEVRSTTIRQENFGGVIENWDSLPASPRTIADFLGQNSGVFIKTYGLGSLATSSVRGGSGSHTAVVWEGFSLQNPALGLQDLALLPGAFIESMQLQLGGASAAWGSGAIGGTIQLRTETTHFQGFAATATVGLGSFGWRNTELKLNAGGSETAYKAIFFRQQADNDFSYRPSPGQPSRRQSNANLLQSGVLQEIKYQLNPRNSLQSSVWLQKADRGIPPTTTQTLSLANQTDHIARLTAHWKRVGPSGVFHLKSAIFYERIHYRDPILTTDARSRFWTGIAELDQTWHFSKHHRLQIGLNATASKVFSENYDQPPTRQQIAAFAFYRFEIKRWNWQVGLRQELVDSDLVPVTPSVGGVFQITNRLAIRTLISKNYRLPTLNDRYWVPGGNPDLLPESGWGEELGLDFGPFKHLDLRFGLTAFNRNTENWIYWTPTDGSFFYAPHNIAKVWSRGLEQRLHFTTKLGKNWALHLRGGYDYVRSTNLKAIKTPKIEAGSQLFYVPKHRAFGKISLQGKTWNLDYQHNTTSGIATLGEDLRGYQIGAFSVGWQGAFNKFRAEVFGKIENCWNANYRVVERRPMPGRYFECGISISGCSKKT